MGRGEGGGQTGQTVGGAAVPVTPGRTSICLPKSQGTVSDGSVIDLPLTVIFFQKC